MIMDKASVDNKSFVAHLIKSFQAMTFGVVIYIRKLFWHILAHNNPCFTGSSSQTYKISLKYLILHKKNTTINCP
jgi:hypothetical protein